MAKLQLTILIPINSEDFNQLYSSIIPDIRSYIPDIRIKHHKSDKQTKVRCRKSETYQLSNSFSLELDSTVETNDRIRLTSLITNDSPVRSNEIAKQKKISTFLASWIVPSHQIT